MSQEIRTSQRISDPSSEQIPLDPQSVNASADKLMDELFSDIDQILDGGKLPNEPAQPEYVSLQPRNIPQIKQTPLPEAVMAPQEPLTQPADNPPHFSPAPIEQNTHAPEKTKSDTKVFGFSHWFDKLLLGVTFTSLAGIVILLLASKYGRNWSFWPKPISSATSQNTQKSKEDAEFIDYMQRSLEAMDRRAKASKQQAMVSGLQLAPNQSLVLVPSNLGQGSNPGEMSLEKVYIPVYPQPQAPNASPIPTPVATPSDSQSASVPESPQRVALPVVPLPKLQGPARVALPSVQVSAEPESTAPATQHRLARVFVGDRSAALFEINGVTQRIQVGENIGTSGWTLVSVINQEATIRRNTEVRSIDIGEKF
ncbi:MAG: hypothetical protein KME08_11295 [Aphanothece sp. CMT-3BRIN-NPC111]|jgi:hypothetical protein|nr:hypothetical protein [Aphanothece sp. CMT-3BRIN-NPC111]